MLPPGEGGGSLDVQPMDSLLNSARRPVGSEPALGLMLLLLSKTLNPKP